MWQRKRHVAIADAGEDALKVGELVGDEMHHLALALNLAQDRGLA
jgi:hypothetical protein